MRNSQSTVQDMYIHIRNLSTLKHSAQKQAARVNNRAKSPKCLKFDDILNLSTPYENNLKRIRKYSQTCIVRVVELWATLLSTWDGKCASPVNSIRKLIFGEWSPKEVTLIFGYWAFYVYPPLVVPPSTVDCTKAEHIRVQFQPSKRIIRDAAMYRDMFLGGKNRLAVMLRVERIVRTAHGDKLKARLRQSLCTEKRNGTEFQSSSYAGHSRKIRN